MFSYRMILAAAAFAVASGAAHAAVSVGDQRFVESAARDGMAEVALARLAQQKALRGEVREFAERMAADHAKANEELARLAAEKGFEMPDGPSRDHQRLQQRLGELIGADFDREYMKHMADQHKKAVSLFDKQAKRGKDPDLKAFAQRQLPGLQGHYQAALGTRDLWKPHTREKQRIPPQ